MANTAFHRKLEALGGITSDDVKALGKELVIHIDNRLTANLNAFRTELEYQRKSVETHVDQTFQRMLGIGDKAAEAALAKGNEFVQEILEGVKRELEEMEGKRVTYRRVVRRNVGGTARRQKRKRKRSKASKSTP